MEEVRPKYPVGINVFVVRGGKILLGKRINCAGHGSWGLPGGHLELGESMIGAGIRELKEETGLIVDGLEFLNLVNDTSGDKHYVQVGFIADGFVGEPEVCEPDKCECWQWFDTDNLPDEVFLGHQQQIKGYIEGKTFVDDSIYAQ